MDKDDIDRVLMKAGRSLLNWTQRELAERAEIALSTLADFERGGRDTRLENIDRIFKELHAGGVRAFHDPPEIGVSMKLDGNSWSKPSATKKPRRRRWRRRPVN